MTSVIDTDKVIEAITRENLLYKERIMDLNNRMIIIEKQLQELNRRTIKYPTTITTNPNDS